MFKRLLSIALICVLTMGMGTNAFARESEVHLSMVTVEDIVKNEVDIVLENSLVSNEEQWILLKDMLGTDYAVFVN